MSGKTVCPKCESDNTIFSEKKQQWLCAECQYTFVEEQKKTVLRIFISYGRDDYSALAERLKSDLQAKGHEVWFDQDKLKEADDWEQYIEDGLHWVSSAPETGRVVFIMTPHSVRRPDGYCLNEIAKILTKSVLVVPVMLVSSEPPLSIYRIQYLDMQDCYPPDDHLGVYEQRLERLILALEEKMIDFEGVQQRLISLLKPIEFTADISRLLHNFTGRDWVFKAVNAWRADENGSKIFWLQGGPGVGKSAIAAWLRDNRPEVVAFHFCDGNDEAKRNPGKLVTSIAFQLSTQLPDYQDRLARLDLADIVAESREAYTLFDKLIVQPLAGDFPVPGRTIVILIDALDEASSDQRNDIALFLSQCAEKTPEWLRFFVTSRPEPEISTLFQSLSPLVLDTSSKDNLNDIADYLRKRLPAITADQTEAILDKSEGLFLYVTCVCDEVDARQLSLDRIEEFPRGLVEVYSRFFLREFRNDMEGYRKDIRPLLEIILASLRPLKLGFIMSVLDYKNRMDLLDRLDTLGSLFPRSGQTVQDTIIPFHRSLKDWLTARELSGTFGIDIDYGNQLIAENGWLEFQQGPEGMDPYYLEWLPQHLFRHNQYDRVVTIMKDFRFMMQRTKTGYLERLFEDFRELLPQLTQPCCSELQAEAAFFRERAHILRRGTDKWPSYKILLQLSVEYADNSPLTRGAEEFLADGRCDWAWLRRERRLENAWEDPCVAVFEGHRDTVLGALIMPDGRVLSWSTDSTIRFWSADGKPLAKPIELIGSFNSILIMPNGQILSWAQDHPTLFLWDTDGELLGVLSGHSDSICGALVTQDARILSWAWDYTLRIWNTDGEPLKELKGHRDIVLGALVMPDNRILSWSRDNTLNLWSAEGKSLMELKGHTHIIHGALIMPDDRILSWSRDNTLRLWNSVGEPLEELTEHSDTVLGALVLTDGRILSWSRDHTLRLWTSNGKPIKKLEGHEDNVLGVLSMPNGRILSWSGDDTLRIWSADGEPLKELKGHQYGVGGALVISGGRILSWSGDGAICIWNADGEPLTKLKGSAYGVEGALIMPDVRRILSWSEDGTLRLWNADGGQQDELEGHTGMVIGILTIPDGRMLSWSGDGTLRLWSTDGEPLAELVGHSSTVRSALLMPDGRILSWSGDGTLRLWSADGGPLAELVGRDIYLESSTRGKRRILGATLMPDGRILSWSWDGTLRLWSADGEPLAELVGHTSVVSGALIMPDGCILSWSWDGTLRLWSAEGKPLEELTEHRDTVLGALVMPDGQILSWSRDNTLRLWTANGKPLKKLEGHEDDVLGAVLLSDDRILSWSDDFVLLIWSFNGEPLAKLEGHTGDIHGALSMLDGRIVSWSRDDTLRIWSADGKILDILAKQELFAKEKTIWQSWLPPEHQAAGYGMIDRSNKVMIGSALQEIFWHGMSECTGQHLFDDGRAIVTQANGQVCLLRTYQDNRRATIGELGEMG